MNVVQGRRERMRLLAVVSKLRTPPPGGIPGLSKVPSFSAWSVAVGCCRAAEVDGVRALSKGGRWEREREGDMWTLHALEAGHFSCCQRLRRRNQLVCPGMVSDSQHFYAGRE